MTIAASSLTRPAVARRASQARQRRRFLTWCLAPALAVLLVVTLAPMVYLVVVSLTPLNLTNPATAWNFHSPWLNYNLLLSDERFLNSLWVQAKLSFWTVGLQMVIGIVFALLLNLRSRLL